MAQIDTKNDPESLYEKCLSSYVIKLNYNVSTLDGLSILRYLPATVLSDVYVKMSQRENLKDLLFVQISELDVFERLLHFSPARQKLFRCVTELTNSNKPLPAQLARSFIERYQPTRQQQQQQQQQQHKQRSKQQKQQQEALKTKTKVLKTAAKLSTLAQAKLHNDQSNISTKTDDASTADDMTECAINVNATVDYLKGLEVNDANDDDDDDNHGDNDAGNDANIAAVADDAAASADSDAHEDTDECDADDFGCEVIDFGLRLGSFLSEAGWLAESIAVLQCVATKLKSMPEDTEMLLVRVDCLQRLLLSEASLCKFKHAENTFHQLMKLMKELTNDKIPNSLLANTYTQFSAMFFARSEYDDSHTWSVMAMRHLEETTPERIAVDVLRQASKACVVKRDFQRANMLICQATCRARRVFGTRHQKYADTLLDYGFFLLNVDSVYQSVKVYKEALDIKRYIFGNRNFHVAIAHEELSYAFYVHEYSTGNFTCARDHVEKAVDIMKDLVPHDNLMLASAKRVKALLLEEIALDKIAEGANDDGMLKQSEELHLFALQLSLDVFGEVNVQTAKHYGNLGRLYQTMNRFDEAERMHQKSIKIKTDLLGPYDYEVGLSIGHLASLYNYQMKKYREAEILYLRSIDINLRLFGRSYSGLEYDYLGLCHVYETLREFEKYLQYATILDNWQILRGQNVTLNKSIYPAIKEDCSLEEVKYQFFHMCTDNLTACN